MADRPVVALRAPSVDPWFTARRSRGVVVVLAVTIAVVISAFLPAFATTRAANVLPTAVVAAAVGTLLPNAMRTVVAAVAFAVVVAVLVSAVVPTFWSQSIQRRAESAASALAVDLPYCIQVPRSTRSGGYRPMVEADELSGFRMQAPGSDGFWYEFHAVLVVEEGTTTRFYNWSYMAANFVPVSDRAISSLGIRARCEPRVHFVDGLTR